MLKLKHALPQVTRLKFVINELGKKLCLSTVGLRSATAPIVLWLLFLQSVVLIITFQRSVVRISLVKIAEYVT